MSFTSFDNLPAWTVLLSLAAHLAAGIALGLLHFRTLWWSTRRLAQGGRAGTTVAMMIARFVLLTGLLALASLEGALPLLTMSLGVVGARSLVMRQAGMGKPGMGRARMRQVREATP
jgi:F1F0 ATPase subunit 2